MPQKSDAEQRCQALDFAGYAQEFLRRNHDYQGQYHAISHLIADDPMSAEAKEMARTWGLMFPLST